MIHRLENFEADPVSISLAYRSASRIQVDEDKISYGFKKVPVDQPRRKIVKNIPEEKLWAIDRSVIELKKAKIKSVDSDIDDYVDDDDIGARRDRINPGYDDLGYAPVVKPKIMKRRKSHDFKLEPLRVVSSDDDDERYGFEDEECIFKRGKIVTTADGDNNYDSPEPEGAYSPNEYDT